MEVLYVTNLDIAASASSQLQEIDPAQVCLELVGDWLGDRTDHVVPYYSLLADGESQLTPAHGRQRDARWEHVAGADTWATRVERRDVAPDGVEFITRLTVGDAPDGVTVRISMARESRATGLTPTTLPTLHQPAIVAALVEDPRLHVSVDGQVQDGRYLQVRSPEETALLAQALKQRKRLPILLLHSRTLEAQATARRCASRLVGLVRVVTMDYRATRHLRTLEPVADVPYSGGLLVWADLSSPPLPVPTEQINNPDRDVLRAALMSRIAPLSVFTRGVDTAYRTARRAASAERNSEAAAASAEAAQSGTIEEQLEAVTLERDRAREMETFATEECAKAEALAQERADEIERLTAQVEQLTLASRFMHASHPPDDAPEEKTLDNTPAELEVADGTSLEKLCQHLERAVEGKIVFTPNATAAWKQADRYATPELMRDSLIKLATVARDLYDDQDRSIGHLDTWVRENYDLRISLQDDKMPKKFKTFIWEDRSYERIPHVKVNDGVPPAECGRIYFALDHSNKQLIVDHVGLHW